MRSRHYTRKSITQRTRENVIMTGAGESFVPVQDAGGYALCDLQAADVRRYTNLEAYPYAFATDFDVLRWVAAMASESPLPRALLHYAEKQGWRIGLADLGTGGYSLDTEAGIIELDHGGMMAAALGRSAFFRHTVLVALIRGLRDIWHEEKLYAFDATHRPEAILMLERARAADIDTVAILAGWELRGAGYTDLWRHMLGTAEGDMAMAYARHLERDPASLYSGSAAAKAFSQWYGDASRVDAADHDTLEHLDYLMLQRGDGQNFGAKPASGADVESLAALPDGVCYLAGLGEPVTTDPYFAGLNDAINQAHLFHILYDMEAVMVAGVPFRDSKLARKIFPSEELKKI